MEWRFYKCIILLELTHSLTTNQFCKAECLKSKNKYFQELALEMSVINVKYVNLKTNSSLLPNIIRLNSSKKLRKPHVKNQISQLIPDVYVCLTFSISHNIQLFEIS